MCRLRRKRRRDRQRRSQCRRTGGNRRRFDATTGSNVALLSRASSGSGSENDRVAFGQRMPGLIIRNERVWRASIASAAGYGDLLPFQIPVDLGARVGSAQSAGGTLSREVGEPRDGDEAACCAVCR